MYFLLNMGIFQPVMLVFRDVTPWKINMEPKIYHPLEKETPLPPTDQCLDMLKHQTLGENIYIYNIDVQTPTIITIHLHYCVPC